MTGFRRKKQLALPHAFFGYKPKRRSILERFRLPLRRYLVVGTGVASVALGIAMATAGGALILTQPPQARDDGRSALIYAYYVPSSPVLEHTIDYQAFTIPVAEAPAEVPPAVEEPPPPPPEPAPDPPQSPVDNFIQAVAEAAARQPAVVRVKGRIDNVNITFYDCKDQGFCGNMANGRKVYEGAAACSWNLGTGTRFTIVGDPTKRVYICEDRGLLSDTWVDIFWHDPADGWRWQAAVGRRGTIEIVEVPH